MTYNYYQIKNLITKKIYIGITEFSIEKRFHRHVSLLNNHTHPNYYLQADWDKYGANNFECSLIEAREYENLEDGYYHEYELIQNATEQLYNIQPGGIVNPVKNEQSYQKMVHTKQQQVPNIYALQEVQENVFKIIYEFPSQKAAGKFQEKWNQSNIQKALKSHYTAFGYFWVDENDIKTNLQNWRPTRKRMKPTAKLDHEGNITEMHHSPRLFEQQYNYRPGAVSASICHNTCCFGNKYCYISEEEYYNTIPIVLLK